MTERPSLKIGIKSSNIKLNTVIIFKMLNIDIVGGVVHESRQGSFNLYNK